MPSVGFNGISTRLQVNVTYRKHKEQSSAEMFLSGPVDNRDIELLRNLRKNAIESAAELQEVTLKVFVEADKWGTVSLVGGETTQEQIEDEIPLSLSMPLLINMLDS